MSNRSYRELIVWREAHTFVLNIYAATEQFPKHELFGITSQVRRASVSAPTNIVEGHAKISIKDQLRFYEIALGSLNECGYLLELVRDLKYIDLVHYEELESQRSKTEYLLLRFMKSKGRSYCSSPSYPS